MDPMETAERALALVSEYDTRFSGLSEDEADAKTAAWAAGIAQSQLPGELIVQAVPAVYASSAERPLNPLGAVLAMARDLQKRQSMGKVLAELRAAPRRTSGPVKAAYEQVGALGVECPSCGADIGLPCVSAGGEGRYMPIPHVARMRKLEK